jgi:glycine/serine hydroxymethyltransferase
MREVAYLIARVLESLSSEETLAETLVDVRRRVKVLTDRFPLYAWKLAAAATTR